MKINFHHSLLSIALLCAALFTLISCEEQPPQEQTPAYGKILNYVNPVSLDYPDFSLRFLEKKAVKRNSTHESTLYLFQLAYGTNYRQLEWVDAAFRTVSYEQFKVEDKTYYLELKASDFLGKSLGEGELIVWNLDQYEKHKQTIAKSLAAKRQQIIAPVIEQENRKARQLETKSILDLYKGYMHIINDGTPEFIDYYLTSLSSSGKTPPKVAAAARTAQINKLFARLNPRWDSLSLQQISLSESKAKLYLEGQSEQGTLIIGASLVKEGSEWKIANDIVLPTDVEGRKAITQFMQSE